MNVNAVSVVLLSAAFSGIASAQTPLRLSLDVHTQSWVADSRFGLSRFTKLCERAGITFVDGGKVDGSLRVDYVESQGARYGRPVPPRREDGRIFVGPAATGEFGTDIVARFVLRAPDDQRELLTLEARAASPSSFTPHEESDLFAAAPIAAAHPESGRTPLAVERTWIDSLHQAAQAELRRNPEYNLTCSALAVMLGVRSEAVQLLDPAVSSVQFAHVLEISRFAPATPSEDAYFKVIHREFGGLDALGPAAVAPLRAYLRLYSDPDALRALMPDEPLHGENASEQRRIADALRILADVSEPAEVADLFAGWLGVVERAGLDRIPVVSLSVIEAFGRTGFRLRHLAQIERMAPSGASALARCGDSRKTMQICQLVTNAILQIRQRRESWPKPKLFLAGRSNAEAIEALIAAAGRSDYQVVARDTRHLSLRHDVALGRETFSTFLSLEFSERDGCGPAVAKPQRGTRPMIASMLPSGSSNCWRRSEPALLDCTVSTPPTSRAPEACSRPSAAAKSSTWKYRMP